jgi:hypothetical protein
LIKLANDIITAQTQRDKNDARLAESLVSVNNRNITPKASSI